MSMDVGEMLESQHNFSNRPSEKSTGDGSLDFRGRPAVRARSGGWMASSLIYGLTVAEEALFIGIMLNLITYLVLTMHQQTAKAANMVTNLTGANYVFAVFWGFLSDSYIRRFWVLVVAQVITAVATPLVNLKLVFTVIMSPLDATIGMVLLIVVVSLKALKPPYCTPTLTSGCAPAREHYMGPLLFALYLVAFGSGGIKSNNPAFGADQFDRTDAVERKQTINFYKWYLFWTQVGVLIAITFLFYIQDSVGRPTSYGIQLGLISVSLICFVLGTPFFRHRIPVGSPLTRLAQVFVAAARKWNVPYPQSASYLLELPEPKQVQGEVVGSPLNEKLSHTDKLRWLDRAAIITNEDYRQTDPQSGPKVLHPWHISTVTQVEGLKRVIQMIPTWLVTIMLFLIVAQFSTFGVTQALTMDRHLGKHFKIPAASMSVFLLLTVLISIPLYGITVIPIARKLTRKEKGLTILQRIGIGLIFSMLSTIVASLVEKKRVHEIREKGLIYAYPGTYQLDLHVVWLIPQNVLLGFSDVFATIALLEFFNEQIPEFMRGTGTSLFASANGVGYFLSTGLVDAVNSLTKHNTGGSWLTIRLNNGGLSNFYWLLAVIMAVTFAWHMGFSWWYEYKKVAPAVFNELPESGALGSPSWIHKSSYDEDSRSPDVFDHRWPM